MVTKELAAAWKAQLLEQGYRPVSVNAMLAAVNKLLVCMGREDCKVRYLKLQQQMFRKSERELTRAEYQRLLDATQARGDIRLLLLLETLCATGIRVSELQHHCGGGEGSAEQGVSPQPAGAVRPDVLRHLPGRGTAGGRAGTQQYRDDPHLPAVHGKRKCPPAGQAWPAQRVGIIIISCNFLETVK